MSDLPLFMDFEASGLGKQSYPIQVAWSAHDGTVSECWFIEPSPDYGWALEEGWDAAAERVHGIPFATLREQGKTATHIAVRMNEQLVGQTLYVDGGAFDQVWCEQLFAAAGLEQRFLIGDYWQLILEMLPPSQTRQSGWQYALQDLAWKQVQLKGGGRRHLADTDVRYLVELYRIALSRS